MKINPGSHIHLMGICGTAMASLAGLLKSMGYKVTGSDQNVYPPMSTQLQELGIEIMQGYKKENLNPRPDLVIVGNVITRQHEEAQALLSSDIPYTSLPKAMGEFAIGDRHSIVVSGTHGKTTVTSMMAKVADECGVKPGFMVGGIPLDYGRSFCVAEGDFFIIEGDEYDTAFFDKVPKFIHYKPKYVILTSVEFDHADIYRDLDDVKRAFRMLIERIPEDGRLIAYADSLNVMELSALAKCKVITYGMKGPVHNKSRAYNQTHYQIVEREIIQGRNHFAVKRYDSSSMGADKMADVAIRSPGEHNALNATAVLALTQELGWPLHRALQGLASYQGVKRRQEVIGTPGGVTLVEDFAHHPTAVKVTTEAIREKYLGNRNGALAETKSGTVKADAKTTADAVEVKAATAAATEHGRLICLFEPRSATSRRKVFQKDYISAFRAADLVIVAKAYDQSKISESERFSTEELVDDICQSGQKALEMPNADAIVSYLKNEVKKDDVVLIMSNGGFDGIYQKLLAAL